MLILKLTENDTNVEIRSYISNFFKIDASYKELEILLKKKKKRDLQQRLIEEKMFQKLDRQGNIHLKLLNKYTYTLIPRNLYTCATHCRKNNSRLVVFCTI